MRVHYAWVVAGVTFLALLVAAGVRGAPGVVIKPIETEFGWERADVSLAVAISLLTFGLAGPIAGAVIDRIGPRRVLVVGALLLVGGLGGVMFVRDLWQLDLLWGVVVGLGTGALGQVLGAVIAQRWFRAHRGVVMGLFGGATSAGQLVFIPTMMALVVALGWRSAIGLLVAASAAVLVPIALLMRDRPEDVRARPYGESVEVSAAARAEESRRTPLARAMRTSDFWLLAGSFFICGYTSNGLIGTHLIPHAVEHGFSEVTTATAVGLMGAMNIVGTLFSGWLSDRYDNRRLLSIYYGFRAVSLMSLPFILEFPQLLLFAIVYGLDWIATVPPTVNLLANRFGRASVGTLYGWVWFGHMVGASVAAYAGGFFRTALGDYHLMFISAALAGFVASALALRIRPPRPVAVLLEPVPQPV